MEIRVLQYFLAVAREQSISSAAESLHLSQPTLSRQIKNLEDELGKQLLIRGNRKITLTEEGMFLRKRAEEIIDLVKRTEDEITSSNNIITGDVYIGTGETDAVRIVSQVAQCLQAKYPQIHFHITSGDSADIIERLDRGLFDFGILLGSINIAKYEYLQIPMTDTWGVLMRNDSPLADRESISAKELCDKPIIISRQSVSKSELFKWFEMEPSMLNIVATYNLVYNASLMVDEGLGYALTLDKLINTTGNSNLCFKPLYPKLEIGMNIVWKKRQIFSKASEKFLKLMQERLANIKF